MYLQGFIIISIKSGGMPAKARRALRGAYDRTKERTETAVTTVDGTLDAFEAKGEGIAEDKFSGESRLSRAAQTQTIISVVAIGVIAAVGILIYGQVASSTPDPENEDLQNSSESVTEGFGSSMELVPTVMIVLVAAVVIGVIQRLR